MIIKSSDVRRISGLLSGHTHCVDGLRRFCHNEPYTFRELTNGIDVELFAQSSDGRAAEIAEYFRGEQWAAAEAKNHQ